MFGGSFQKLKTDGASLPRLLRSLICDALLLCRTWSKIKRPPKIQPLSLRRIDCVRREKPYAFPRFAAYCRVNVDNSAQTFACCGSLARFFISSGSAWIGRAHV